jgi:hypothetical protein
MLLLLLLLAGQHQVWKLTAAALLAAALQGAPHRKLCSLSSLQRDTKTNWIPDDLGFYQLTLSEAASLIRKGANAFCASEAANMDG